ncbi:prephenate dehydratase [Actinopolyspora erythraea]|uniref:Prephenate dehydratase n=1 Tax=Actinopolyspora erythraea TaxID=414996 RepID=A0A099DAL7_9ACTN|nr:prephenate dehydratase [Actinopolyspora erythraea]ASU77086.1 prephenate dehydratase [Actinopolyspora erythraea]KGI83228.1 prephenate dehydratase [Actinopolyspora erythraea]
MPRIAYLGPQGTFTEQATRALTADFAAELIAHDTVHSALDAVRLGDVEAAGVPMENSVEGAVAATLDGLVGGDPLVAVAELVLPIRFDVLLRPEVDPLRATSVASHPHALAQVRGWLSERLPRAQDVPTASTATAAAEVESGTADAAVVAPVATHYHPELTRLASEVADVDDAVTRFLLVRRPGRLPEPTGADRTSIAVVAHDEVGALGEVLSELSLRGINLSRIESRPTKDRLGAYRFFLDFDGHVADTRIGDALTGLHRRCFEVRFLGSFPKADSKPVNVRAADSEQAFRRSMGWLDEVRAGRTA